MLLLLLLSGELRYGDSMSAVLDGCDGISVRLNWFRGKLVLDHSESGRRRSVVQRQTGQIDARRHDALVVIRVDADQILLQIERVLTVLLVLEFVLVKVRPSPKARVYYVGKSLPGGHLKTTIQRSFKKRG